MFSPWNPQGIVNILENLNKPNNKTVKDQSMKRNSLTGKKKDHKD